MAITSIITDVWQFREVIKNFVAQDLKVKYRRSYLGFFWSLLNPMLQLAVISAVFSTLFRFDIRSYALYVLSGLIPWSFLSTSITESSMSVISAESMLKRQYFPKLIFPLSIILQNMVTFVLSLIALLVFLGVFIGFKLTPSLFILPVSFFYIMATALGLGAIAAVLNVYFRDVQHLIGVILSAWFYITPIIYPIEAKQAKNDSVEAKPGTPAGMVDTNTIPHEYRQYFKLNPFFSIIEMFHRPIYDGRLPTRAEFLSATVVAFGCLGGGLLFFGYFDKRLIFHL